MQCEKCQMLAAGGAEALPHSDLRHVNVRLNAVRGPLAYGRTDEYVCRACATRWEADFDPTPGLGRGPFRVVD